MQPLNPIIASQLAAERRDRATAARLLRRERPRFAFLARRRGGAPTARVARTA
jgi:hypothetical protein